VGGAVGGVVGGVEGGVVGGRQGNTRNSAADWSGRRAQPLGPGTFRKPNQ
jgi:hypothetical protein